MKKQFTSARACLRSARRATLLCARPIAALTAILTVCGAMMNTACSPGNDDNPVTPSTEDVHLTQLVTVTLSPNGVDTLAVMSQHLTWENGLLKHTYTIIRSPMLNRSAATEDHYDYEGTNCTAIHHGTGTEDRFTYADGHLLSAVSTMSDGTTRRYEMTAHTADGHISEMTEEISDNGHIVKRSYSLIWKDGDLVSYITHFIAPADEDVVSTCRYHDIASPYLGYPVAQYAMSPSETAHRGSSHYFDDEEELTMENGRIVVAKDGSTTYYFVYSDGTGASHLLP